MKTILDLKLRKLCEEKNDVLTFSCNRNERINKKLNLIVECSKLAFFPK